MGLDGVELLMECENEFGIRISDSEATKVTTPGQLTQLVIKLMRRDGAIAPAPVCPSARVFNELRCKLVSERVERDIIRPRVRLEQLFRTPSDVRRSEYTLRTSVGQVARRTRSDQLLRFVAPAFVAVAAIPLLLYSASHLPSAGAALVFMCMTVILMVTSLVLNERRSELIDSRRTIGELVQRSVSEAISLGENTEEMMIWLKVRAIVAEQLGQPIDRVTPDADFVRDLGMQ